MVGGVEHHVGGWAMYEAERRSASRYGVGGGDLYPGRTYVGASDAVASLMANSAYVLPDAVQRLGRAQSLVAASRLRDAGALSFTTVDIDALSDSLGSGDYPDAAQASLALLAAKELSDNCAGAAGLAEMYAGASAAGDKCYSELEEMCAPGSAGARGVDCSDARALRALESRCVMPAARTEVFVARTAAFVEAVAAALAQFEGARGST
jgi:hypothetical protein